MSPSPSRPGQDQAVRRYADSWSAIMRLVRDGSSWSGRERNCAFLNLGLTEDQDRRSPRFTDVSAVAGLDAVDDGRAIAVVDWDHDGDLDLWLRNRNAPRLRLMLNGSRQANPQRKFISLRLRGRDCNRDAIGARVSIHGDREAVLVRSVTAGDAFMSQSSKRLHFALPDGWNTSRVDVLWPGGSKESFELSNGEGDFHELVQGTSQSTVIAATQRSSALSGGAAKAAPNADAARIVLPLSLASPTIKLWDTEGNAASLEGGSATLLVFWSSSCPHCLEELTELAAQQSMLKSTRLNVVAVCLDELERSETDDQSPGTLPAVANEVMTQLALPFSVRQTSIASMNRVRHLQNGLFDMNPAFVVPFGMLLDQEQRVVCIYRGAFAVDTYLTDRALVDLDQAARRKVSVPCDGSWFTLPATNSQFAEFVGKRMLSHDREEGIRYLTLALKSAESDDRRVILNKQLQRIRNAGPK